MVFDFLKGGETAATSPTATKASATGPADAFGHTGRCDVRELSRSKPRVLSVDGGVSARPGRQHNLEIT